MSHRIIAELEQLIPHFCRLSFDSTAALRQWGATASTSGKRAEVVKPRALSADRLELERTDLAFAAGFPSTLNLTWSHPEQVGLAELETSFGPSRRVRGTALNGPAYYVFQLDDEPLPALLRFTVDASSRSGQLNVRQVSLRRMPPDPEALTTECAVRFIVLADLHATEDLSDRVPLPTTLRSRADLKELIVRLQPIVAIDVPNRLHSSSKLLHLHFSLSAIDDFKLDNLLASIPAGAALLRLRRRLGDLRRRKISGEQFRAELQNPDLPPCWVEEASACLSDGEGRSDELVRRLDEALSAQADAMLANTQFQAFQSAWLGLAYLVEHFDFSSGSHIEVFSAPPHAFTDILGRGFVNPEKRHHAGHVPALVLADFAHADNLPSELPTWSALADRVRVPVIIGSDSAVNLLPDGRSATAANGYLAAIRDQLCVRSSSTASAAPRFTYSSSPSTAPTQCWASGVWAVGALAAISLAESGRIALRDVSLARPALCAPPHPWIRPGTRTYHEDGHDSGDNTSIRLGYDASADQAYVIRMCALYEPAVAAESFEAKLVFAPILHFALRWLHQHGSRHDAASVALSLQAAATRRFPETVFAAEYRESPSRHLRLCARPQFPIRDNRVTLELAIPWPE